MKLQKHITGCTVALLFLTLSNAMAQADPVKKRLPDIDPELIEHVAAHSHLDDHIRVELLLRKPAVNTATLTRAFETQRKALRNSTQLAKNAGQVTQVNQKRDDIDSLRQAHVDQIARQHVNAMVPIRRDLEALVMRANGVLEQFATTSGYAVISIPLSEFWVIADSPMIRNISRFEYGKPHMGNVVQSQGLTAGGTDQTFWAAGFWGGSFDIGILDAVFDPENASNGGVEQSHPALQNLDWVRAPLTNTWDNNGHPTAVAATILSSDLFDGGIADTPDKVLLGDCISRTLVDLEWFMTSSGDAPEVVNRSCGGSRFNDAGVRNYTDEISNVGKSIDHLIDTYQFVYVHSAGNDGNVSKLTSIGSATSYNAIMVGAVRDQNTVTFGDDRIAGFSSRGPTPLGRKKPDLVAPGHKIYTANYEWDGGVFGSEPDFKEVNGTSFSSPIVAGGAMLLTDALDGPDPLIVKAILINSARSWHDNGTLDISTDDYEVNYSTWNSSYGWGYMDLSRAWSQRNNYILSYIGDGIAQPDTVYFRTTLPANGKVTMTWNKHENNSPFTDEPSEALSDLNLYIYEDGTHAPVAGSLSSRDNVEQVSVGAAGSHIVKIKSNGLNVSGAVEKFALAGMNAATLPPRLEIDNVAFTPGSTSERYHVSFRVRNVGGLNAPNMKMELNLPPGWTHLGSSSITLASFTPGSTHNPTFEVQANCSTAGGSLSMRASSNTLGETFFDQVDQLVNGTAVKHLGATSAMYSALPVAYEADMSAAAWTIISTISSSNSGKSVPLEASTDSCFHTIEATSTRQDIHNPDWVAINGSRVNEAYAYARASADDGTGSASHWAKGFAAEGLLPGAISDNRKLDSGSPVFAWQVSNLYPGQEILAKVHSAYSVDMWRVDGSQTSAGADPGHWQGYSSANQITVQGGDDSPLVVVATKSKLSQNVRLEFTQAPDCTALPLDPTSDAIFKSNFENNEPATLQAWPLQRQSRVAHFPVNASQNAVLIADSNSLDVTEITVEAMVKLDPAMMADGLNFILSKNIEGSGFALLATGSGSAKRFRFEVAGVGFNSTTPVVAGKWYHVAATYSNGYALIFVNGVAENNAVTFSYMTTNDQDLRIGSSIFGDHLEWKGAIDEVRIWDHQRDANELRQTANSCLSGQSPNLKGYWRFDTSNAGVAIDASSNGNTGTLINVTKAFDQ